MEFIHEVMLNLLKLLETGAGVRFEMIADGIVKFMCFSVILSYCYDIQERKDRSLVTLGLTVSRGCT